jgi:RNA polymerase sigma-70 factor (ECF subfamily)
MGENDRTDQNPSARGYPTASLLARAGEGDSDARDRIVERYWQALRSWAHGRLPPTARERADTDDLVQLTLIKILKRLGTVEVTRKGDFTAYLHRVLLNQIRDEIRRAVRRPRRTVVDEDVAAKDPSPLRIAADNEFMTRYRKALDTLPEKNRMAIVMRLEMGHAYTEIASAVRSPSANAARMLVKRSIERLAKVLENRG